MEIIDGGITAPLGFQAAGVHCGIKREKPDLALIYIEKPAAVSMVFTQNKVRAANIEVLAEWRPTRLSAFVVNSGNANALTGERGIEDAKRMASITAAELGLDQRMVGMASTGIIGHFLPMDKIERGIKSAAGALSRGREADKRAASAIMTTDTVTKEAACRVTLRDGTRVTIGGMAKGSGMISPAMKSLHATTLSFITTDANLEEGFDRQFGEVIDSSFNMVNVDGDQSTNDMSVLMANGMAGGEPANDDSTFWEAVRWVAQELAKQVARDGEGATKLIEVFVTGAADVEDARSVARAIVHSNLVKAAIFGADPNYGRVLAAIGSSGAKIDLNKMALSMGPNGSRVPLFSRGKPLIAIGEEGKEALRSIMGEKTVKIMVDLGLGEASATAWGCDLSYDYVKINAEYTT